MVLSNTITGSIMSKTLSLLFALPMSLFDRRHRMHSGVSVGATFWIEYDWNDE